MREDDATPFTATVHHRDGMAVLVLAGLLDRRADTVLEEAIDVALGGDAGTIDAVGVDCTRLDYINSSGIALVVGLLTRARAASLPVRVWGLSEHFRHIFGITRLADHVTFYPDEAAAGAGGVPTPA